MKEITKGKELRHETNVLYQYYNPLSKRPRASKSRIWDEFQHDYEDGDSDATISEYHSAGDQSAKDGEGILYQPIKGCRIYLQKNGRCFTVRAGCGIHLSPRPILTGIRRATAWALAFTMVKVCW